MFHIIYQTLLIAVVIVVGVVGLCLADYFIRTKPKIEKARKIAEQYKDKDSVNISKQGFTAKKIDELEKAGKFDAIVIGSGLSGLTTSALLSRRGWKVLCLEQHDIAGGCTHAFEDKGYEFDTGVHYIGGHVGNKKSMFGFLFDMLSLSNLKWNPMDKIYDTCYISNELKPKNTSEKIDQTQLDCYSTVKEFEESLIKKFPEEESSIKYFIRLVGWAELVAPALLVIKLTPMWLSRVLRKILNPFLKPFTSMSTAAAIKTITSNKILAGCLSWCWGDFGTPPSESPLFLTLLVAGHYINGGAYYPEGGSSNIATTIIPTIEAAGGKVLVRAPVSHIIIDESGKRAIGVHVRGRDIYAKYIVSSAGVINTYGYLIKPESVELESVSHIRASMHLGDSSLKVNPQPSKNPTLEPSCAMISVFVGLKGSPKELGMKAQNYWVYSRWEHDEAIKTYNASAAEVRKYLSSLKDVKNECIPEKAAAYDLPLVFISSSTAKDVVRSDCKKTSVELLTVVDYKSFQYLDPKGEDGKPGSRGSKYEEVKKIIEKKLVKVLMEAVPTITEDKIELVSSGSPLTSNFYYGTHHGEVYGLSHTCDRFGEKFDSVLRPQQEIQGLFLTGQDMFSDGIAGALMSGVMTAIAMDKTVPIDLFSTYIVEYA